MAELMQAVWRAPSRCLRLVLGVWFILSFLACGGGSGSAPKPSSPVISSFSASPATLTAGQSTSLAWVVSGAKSLAIDSGVGSVSGTGLSVAPTTTTTYTLTATNDAGSSTASVSVRVDYAISFTAGPGGDLTGALSQTVAGNGAATAVTANPALGYAFVNWTGAGFPSSTANPLTVSNPTSNLALTANFRPRTFTISFTAGPGGTLGGALNQTVAYGDSCSAVTAIPDSGYFFANWTGPGLGPSTANPLILANVTSDQVISANFTGLAEWLNGNPRIAGAIKWQFRPGDLYNAYTPPAESDKIRWTEWTQGQKDDLNQAFVDACAWFAQGMPAVQLPSGGLTDEPTNLYPSVASDSITTLEWISPAYMWKLYVAHVAFSLSLELGGRLPWSITTYTDEQLRYLFDSSTMARGLPNGNFNLGTYGGANLPGLRANNLPHTAFAPPIWTYQFILQGGLLASTRLDTIGNTLEWMRRNMVHFYGADNFGNAFAVWQYRGFPPISKIVGGTIDSNNVGLGAQHWTAGCHGSVGFMNAILRTVNIPVQPVWVSGHELGYFMTEGRYLDHGDDPYNNNVKNIYPNSPVLSLLIDEATYGAWFTNDPAVNILDPYSPALANVGRKAAEFR